MGAHFVTSAANTIVFSSRKNQVPVTIADLPYKHIAYDGNNRLYIRCLRAMGGAGEVPGDPNIILIHCYGNGESTADPHFMYDKMTFVDRMQEHLSDSDRLALIVFDYPGYGRSDGNETNEENICLALEKVYEFARNRYGDPGTRFLLWGRSIGTVPVCRLTKRLCETGEPCHIDGVILESGIASTWYVRFGVYLEHVFNNGLTIEQSNAWPSTLIIHGVNDGVVYVESSRELAGLIETKRRQSPPALYHDRLQLLPNKGHDDLSFTRNTVEFRAFVEWMKCILLQVH